MNISCSSAGIVYADYPKQGALDLAKAGFKSTMLNFAMFCPSDVLENFGVKKIRYQIGERVVQNPSRLQVEMQPLLDAYQTNQLQTNIGIAPGLMGKSERRDMLEVLIQLVEQSLAICKTQGVKYLLVGPLWFEESEEIEKQLSLDYYMRLAKTAKACGVMLLVSNMCKNLYGHVVRSFCSDGESAREWVDLLNKEASLRYGKGEYFGFFLHVGTCNLCAVNMYDFAVTMAERIKVVLLTENSGHNGGSLLPFSCAMGATSQTDWLNLIRGLRKIGFDGELVIEFCDTVLSFSTILRPQVLSLAKATAEYLKWQIELENVLKKYPSRVLFGAGNMCRNYMKCYGEEFPPLFTCDNNPEKWGAEFCGLTIQSPEALKELKEETAIFICNIYYREIEQQLREMGLKNPIEFFNDEYMPTFYFDRVEDVLERKENGGQ